MKGYLPLHQRLDRILELLEPKPVAGAEIEIVVDDVTLYKKERSGKSLWIGTATWNDKAKRFELASDGPGNWDFSPEDLEEVARVLRRLKREP